MSTPQKKPGRITSTGFWSVNFATVDQTDALFFLHQMDGCANT